MTMVDPERVAGLSGGSVRPGQPACLVASRCTGCARTEFPLRTRCPACGSTSGPEPLPSAGRLVGFTAVLHPPPGADVEVPYTVGVVEFDGRIRVLGLVIETLEDLEVGRSMETVGHPTALGDTGYAFRSC
jgi:uncharacterized OB-fold protein